MWRKISYGTQTEHGNGLVDRLPSIRETCRLQGRCLQDHLTAAITADLHGHPIPTRCRPDPHSVNSYDPGAHAGGQPAAQA
ncbi:MAG: hypothetical protein WKF48_02205 [Solirubrobacteraceae bacterium]